MMDSEKNSLSHLSSYSIIVFAMALFLSVFLDILFPWKPFPEPANQYMGILVVALGTFIVYWAQFHGVRFSHKRKKGEVTSVEHLEMGPYGKTRHPKYIGLGVLLIGLGIILNSIFVTVSSVISILVINYFLLPKEENFMMKRHGELYDEYKKKVKRWF